MNKIVETKGQLMYASLIDFTSYVRKVALLVYQNIFDPTLLSTSQSVPMPANLNPIDDDWASKVEDEEWAAIIVHEKTLLKMFVQFKMMIANMEDRDIGAIKANSAEEHLNNIANFTTRLKDSVSRLNEMLVDKLSNMRRFQQISKSPSKENITMKTKRDNFITLALGQLEFRTEDVEENIKGFSLDLAESKERLLEATDQAFAQLRQQQLLRAARLPTAVLYIKTLGLTVQPKPPFTPKPTPPPKTSTWRSYSGPRSNNNTRLSVRLESRTNSR